MNKSKFLIGLVTLISKNCTSVLYYMQDVAHNLYSDAGFDIDTPDDFGRTCLHAAAAGG